MVASGVSVRRKRLARMALLTAGRLAGRFTQAADPRRLLQPVAGRWLAAVAAVQPKTALQVRQPPHQHRDSRQRSGAFSACKAAITASLLAAVGAPSRQGVSSGGAIDTLTRTRAVTCQYPPSQPMTWAVTV